MTNATVVTGIGVLAPNGIGAEEFWEATLRGESGIGRITRFDPSSYPSRLAGEVTGFSPRDHVPSRLVPQTDRTTQFALAGSDWALADSGLDAESLTADERGVVTASASGGFEFGQRELGHLWGKDPKHVSAYMSFAWFYAVNTGQLSIRHDLRGPTGVVVTDQAGGLDAVAQARRRIRKGTPLMLTGGMDASLCPYGLAAQISAGILSGSDDPGRAYLPFDAAADGHVPGEGGAILTLEGGDRARERGARSHGQISGYAATFDPRPGSGRPGNLERAIRGALADAELGPRDIALVLADGAGEPEQDLAEARALAAVFGPGGVPVTVPKTMTGRLYAGAAPLDLVTALFALRDGVVPPTVHVDGPAPGCDIDLVTGSPRPVEGDAALIVARGRGGFNSAMVVRRPPTD
ncbi:ketosynthase chain-length factor [Streptomyces fructofermentans]|uniref:Actinorhodin polyketide putative beta-ketoacyl synthase 2 n=1 Tax=Streptomyces fructofermentans TaxID=152141 RepID=A0A918K1Q8_9ACTN|nr:ketosynthase chain-length factor [Streptomyces fructofermentans]GGX44683.1 actinorhodin polyketide putative beta-ketoacyl synthase 2 [Streptomyces fructofermentans]